MTAGAERPFLRWGALVLAVVCAACGDDPTASSPACTDQIALSVDAPVEAALLAGDRRFAGAYIDYYGLQLDAPARLRVGVTSGEIQPLILIFGSSGDVVAQAYQVDPPPDSGQVAPSLVRDFSAGCTLIGVSSYELMATGVYTVQAQPAP